MMTRRIMEGIVIVSVLLWPAKSTVKMWGRKQLAVHQEGEVMHGVGTVITTVLG